MPAIKALRCIRPPKSHLKARNEKPRHQDGVFVTTCRAASESERHALAAQVVIVGAAEVDHSAWAQLDNTSGQRGYELTVMADEYQGARVVLQCQVQRLDGFHVQVVGRFVHDQHVGLLQDQLAEQHATLLTTGNDFYRLEDVIVGKQHAAQSATDHLLALSPLAHPVEQGHVIFEIVGMVLGVVAQFGGFSPLHCTCIRGQLVDQGTQQGGFTDTVRANDRNALAGFNGEAEVLEQGLASSRAKAIDKITLAEVKPSSRVSPFIRFEQNKKLHRQAVIVEQMAKGFDGKTLFKDFSFTVEAGERVAIIGPNGIGKTTLLRTLVNELTPDAGTVKWTEAAELGYYAQDHAHDFEDDMTLFDWMGQWTQGEQMVRGTLGRMLFSNDDILKSVKVISGGEQGRMLFGKLILQKANVLVMDEPTNHLDMESIEALNLALENYPGTLVFVSHDREFVSSLATRIIELSPSGVIDFSGTYDDYLRSQGVTF